MSAPDARFPRSVRLLTSRDYKAVFDDAPYRASSPELLILARRNGASEPRLGVVVGKKNCRLAIQRNRIKRLTRESFRQSKEMLAGLDLIVLARKGVSGLDNPEFTQLLAKLWKRVLKKAQAETGDSSASPA